MMKLINLKICLNHNVMSIKRNLITSLCVMWKKNDLLINMISVPSTITPEEPYLFRPSMIELTIVLRMSPIVFSNTFDKNKNSEVDDIKILFISDLEDMIFSHYMAQPKSMLCRKLKKFY